MILNMGSPGQVVLKKNCHVYMCHCGRNEYPPYARGIDPAMTHQT